MPASPPEQETSLLEIIRSLPSERPLLRAGNLRLNAGETADRADALRKEKVVRPQQPAVLHGQQPLELLLQMIAADGYCSRQLLLPATINHQLASQLASRAFETPASQDSEWLLTTSGTTGSPKLISHSLASLSSSLKRNFELGAGYRWGLTYDPCRFAGLQIALQAFYSGSELVLTTPDDFDKQVRTLLAAEINALSATPTYWRKLAIDGRMTVCPLKQITIGGEIVDQKLLDHLRLQFPTARISHIYASTEAGVGFAVTDGHAGFPLSYLTDNPNNPQLRIDAANHLWIRPTIAPPATLQNRAADDFLNSHDLVEVRDNRVFFLGRANGTINVGGNKVHPEFVEGVLREFPGVVEVRVWGKKNPFTGEILVAEVVPAFPTGHGKLQKKILDQCQLQLESWQIPALIRFVDKINSSPAGKLCRTERNT